MIDVDKLDRVQKLLYLIVKDRCGGKAAKLAKAIEKDPSYINRLFYHPSKKGAKGIGLEIMTACTAAFNLPKGYWDEGLGDSSDGKWPFPDIEPERFSHLTPTQKTELQGIVRFQIQKFEAENEALAIKPNGSTGR